jgi:hypothetical protein
MSDVPDFIRQVAGHTLPPSDQALRKVSMLAAQQKRLVVVVEHAEADLKAAKAALIQNRERDLPDAMTEAGVKKFVTTDGLTIDITTQYYASGEKINIKPEAFGWLKATNHEDIVKNDVILAFNKGQDAEAQALISRLRAEGYTNLVNKPTIHASTLKGFVREMEQEGTDVPLEAFGLYRATVAIVK